MTRTDLIKMLPKNLIFAELGVFIGDFSREIIRHANPKTLYLVDMFAPGECYSGDKDGENEVIVPDLSVYFEILTNKYKTNKDIKVVKSKTSDFLKRVDTLDAVYIDASHLYEDVLIDLLYSLAKIKSGYILGHDYNQEEVKNAVDFFCKTSGVNINYLSDDKCPSYLIVV
jgi:hypothetical protein